VCPFNTILMRLIIVVRASLLQSALRRSATSFGPDDSLAADIRASESKNSLGKTVSHIIRASVANRISNFRMFFGLMDPNLEPLVRGSDPAPDP
jgi:hypothetical protein